ncbi:MAG: NADH-quinone oxidoreductase subunit C [Candidatus Heimdallarchaeota archaeon]|nr:NADH-quinone oxidoreductase subunit C [Candidatus Heimdallarchaeota archaeon]MDH5647419.1 NADH-quinone oxidoreductase subunit C [Candidatus Heimdallarchaeota archaeon]
MSYNAEQIINSLKSEFNEKILEATSDDFYRVIIKVPSELILEIAGYIQHELGFSTPNMCSGTDKKEFMEVFWHIGTVDSPILIVLKSELNRDNPVVESLTPLWKGFDWHERETYDLLGINFNNHPDLRRLLMPDNWEGHPLREDYVYKKPKYRKPED